MDKYDWLCTCAVAALALQAYEARAQEDGGGRGRDVTCVGEIGDTRVDGDLNVVGKCTLAGTEVRGNVTLFSGGSLTTRDARIRGDVDGNRADYVDFERSQIDGKVELDQLVGDVSTIELTQIHGDVELTANLSQFQIVNSDFGGNLVASFNTGGLNISGNSVENDLRCVLNSPAPTGIGNRVDGDSVGQCENFESGNPPPTPAPSPPPPTPTPTAPPASSPPPATPPAAELIDEGGAGAMGWLTWLLAPLVLAKRRGLSR